MDFPFADAPNTAAIPRKEDYKIQREDLNRLLYRNGAFVMKSQRAMTPDIHMENCMRASVSTI